MSVASSVSHTLSGPQRCGLSRSRGTPGVRAGGGGGTHLRPPHGQHFLGGGRLEVMPDGLDHQPVVVVGGQPGSRDGGDDAGALDPPGKEPPANV